MTALVPSETACLANSPGRTRRTAVWISRLERGGFLVVANQFAGFGRDLVEDVVDEGVHDGHTFLGHTGVWVDLFQDLVDVDRETFGAARTAFGAGGLLRGFLCWGFGHFEFDKF